MKLAPTMTQLNGTAPSSFIGSSQIPLGKKNPRG
jgi:hypothetical protein